MAFGTIPIYYKYVYDAFGRLRKMLNQSDELVAEYVYNGLGHRIGVHYDVNEDGDVDGDDPWFWFAYDERWRVVATFRDDDEDPKEIFVYHAAGLGGFGGSSYIDAVILRDRDANTDWDAASDGVLEERIYYCQNWRHDVVALITDAGAQVQQIRYSAYGIPIGLPAGDVSSNGEVSDDDDTIIAGWISGSAYDVRGDLNLDGVVDNADRTLLQANLGVSLGWGVMSLAVDHAGATGGGGNRKGYAGYEGDFSRDGFWHVRHRVLDSELGRWTKRDPLGYVDGVSLYQYIRSVPTATADPLCLSDLVPYDKVQYCGPEIGESFERTMARNCRGLCHWLDPGWPDCFADWLFKVWDGGDWDYKRHDFSTSCIIDESEYECPTGQCRFSVSICGTCLREDVLGNLNYGYTGRCIGLSERMLLRGSLWAAHIFNGDEDGCDVAAIKAGYWLRGNWVSALFEGPRTLCDAIARFSLWSLCGMPLCSPCPCDDSR